MFMSVEKIIKLKEGESILGVIRQFPLVHIPFMVLAIILFVAPFFFMIPLFSFETVGVVVFGLLTLSGLLLVLRTIICWYWTVFIVTDCRVIDVDQRGLFNRFVSEASYEKVQDIAYARKGVLGTIFNYGTLVVQTAGVSAHLEQYFVRRPQDVQHLIVEAMNSYLAKGPPSGRNDKASTLLGAASALTNTEARAFITELKEAVDEEKQDVAGATEDEVEHFMTDNRDEDQSIFNNEENKS